MLALALLLAANVTASAPDTTPIDCRACPGWNAPQASFRLHGDSWYVGTRGLSAVLVATREGLVLIDGGLPQSAALIAANIESLQDHAHGRVSNEWTRCDHAMRESFPQCAQPAGL